MGLKRKIADISNYLSGKKYLDLEVKDFQNLPFKIFQETSPVFVLSTGRCGTKLLTNLFEITDGSNVYHEPHPQMIYASRYAYENLDEGIKIRKSAFFGARYELLKDAFLKNQRYIETNNQITFFADAIYDLIPHSIFIHLIRHPGDFVRSGIRRKYYNGHDYDDGRILLNDVQKWESYSEIQKVGWLWNETNSVIEKWKSVIPQNNVYTCRSEGLFSDPTEFQNICEFIGIDSPDSGQIENIIKKPANVQKKGSFPKYNDWSNDDQNELKGIAELGYKYAYFNKSE